MKKIVTAIFLFFIMVVGLAGAEETQLMFVQNAHGIAFDNHVLTLKGVGPTTLFFADRPKREVGHMTTLDFLKGWDEGDNNFAVDPPNAALSIFDEQTITNVIVVLSEPRLKDHDLMYTIRVLDGEMPASGGECSIFIDPLGRPASATSVAGVHRRERRHAVVGPGPL
jgi:hypothetical protein